MRFLVLAVGRLRPPYVDDVEHYRGLLARHARVEVVEVREDERVERRIPERAYVALLDVGGRAMSSEQLARWLEDRRHAGRDLCFVVGGPFGIGLEACDERLSFGPMTLPHQ